MVDEISSMSERGHHRPNHHPRPGINAAGGKSWQLAIQLLEALKMQFSRFKVIIIIYIYNYIIHIYYICVCNVMSCHVMSRLVMSCDVM